MFIMFLKICLCILYGSIALGCAGLILLIFMSIIMDCWRRNED